MYKEMLITKDELEYLRRTDERMKKLIDSMEPLEREIISDPFTALVNGIIYQQITFKAANTIWKRFTELVGEVTPSNVQKVSPDSFRECGLSKSKANYVKNIAVAVLTKEIIFEDFKNMTDEEIGNALIKIKGIGNWTIEMFLIFSLDRRDVMSYNDLAIRKGLKWLYNMEEEPTKEEFKIMKERFSPYNTIASLYLWEITIRNYFTRTLEEV